MFFVSFITVFELLNGAFLKTFAILSPLLLPIKSSVSSSIFLIARFKAVLNESNSTAPDCINVFAQIFSKRQNSIVLYKYFITRLK